ncbi:hypothetical protein HK44_018595 [Pseudomonas fluorescens HK44]|uniref:Uncharacterized protein n=1 Tax=Pseudomonas fluorescens HK44 TaxID=1042209 RepID=A0A010SJH7_PSEFL|nr:hypothetical protein [Pseudomonas fluorescens]EXF91358.1 hypothetical protein HK44_018595 [Pseudomonas fluorescens HK44]
MLNMDLLKEISAMLDKDFEQLKYGIKADETYLNSTVVNDLGQRVVDYSQTLSWAIMEKVQDDEFPAFGDEYAGVFTRQWTFDPLYRVDNKIFNIEKLNLFGRGIVEYYRAQ